MKPSILKRKKSLLLAIVIGIVFFSGCTVLSFYPFYTKDVLKQDKRVEGKWIALEDDDSDSLTADSQVWEITDYKSNPITDPKTEKEKAELELREKYLYNLKIYTKSDSNKSSVFDLHLMEVDGQLYFDFYPEDWEGTDDILEIHLMPSHSLAKISISDSITINWLDKEWFEDMLNENRIRIHHERNKDYTLLTAKPEELQKFIKKYGKDKAAWEDGLLYTLKKYPS